MRIKAFTLRLPKKQWDEYRALLLAAQPFTAGRMSDNDAAIIAIETTAKALTGVVRGDVHRNSEVAHG